MSEILRHIERIAELIIKYRRENLNDTECKELTEWYDQSHENRQIFDRLSNPDWIKNKISEFRKMPAYKVDGWEKIVAVTKAEGPSLAIMLVRGIKWIRYLVTASLIGTLAAGVLFCLKYRTAKIMTPQGIFSNFKSDLAPGGGNAIFTLSDGDAIILNRTGKGIFAHQGITNFVKIDNGRLAYNLLNEKPVEIRYNTFTTPVAG